MTGGVLTQAFAFFVGGALSDESAACLIALEERFPDLSMAAMASGSPDAIVPSFLAYACLTDEEGERLYAGPGGAAASAFFPGDVPLVPSQARCVAEELGEEGLAGLNPAAPLPPPIGIAFATCIGGAMDGMDGGDSGMSDTAAEEERAAFIAEFGAFSGVTEESAACVADALSGFDVPVSVGGLALAAGTASTQVEALLMQCGISLEVLQQLPGGSPSDGSMDGGSMDGGSSDGGSMDGGSSDGGSMDGGSSDGGSMDGGSSDGGSMDGGSSDGGSMDGGSSDGGSMDGGATDERAAFIAAFTALPGVTEQGANCVADILAQNNALSLEGLAMGAAVQPEGVAALFAACGIPPEVLQQLPGVS